MSSARGAVIVGVGGIGAPAAAALAHAGIGRLKLVDPDAVELSNLPRQPLYGIEDVGALKVEVAARQVRRVFSGGAIETCAERLVEGNGKSLLVGWSVILDGTDGVASKLLLNQLALDLDVPLVHAGAVGLGGQLFTVLPHRSACLRCLFPEPPSDDDAPSCQQAGILGPVVGAVGLAAAREALAVIRGKRPALVDRLAILDGERLRWRTIALTPNPRCPACRAYAARR
jgi:molybdopterin/thiamine biosynthesis adenylyltransferase